MSEIDEAPKSAPSATSVEAGGPESGPHDGGPESDPVGAASSEKVPASSAPASVPASAPVSSARPVVDPLVEAKAEAARTRDQLLRTAADFDNFRKRTRRELEDASRRGKESALKELLPVFDNLERAAAHSDATPDAKSVADGLRMVMKQFASTLDRLGVTRVQSVGQPFDPALHEAIQHLESAEHAAGIVLAEVLGGYLIGEHLLRAAMVVVSKGKTAEAETVPKPPEDLS